MTHLTGLRRSVALALLALAGCATAPGQPAEEGPPPKAALAQQWLGSASCASMACHNGNGLKGELRSEYTTWIAHDPHARAYEVLYGTTSRAIVKNLKFPAGTLPYELPLCLNCHVHKDYAGSNHHTRFAREDGVGCESCHGPAGSWVSEHYKPGWAALTAAQKTERGMWDTASLAGRVRSCTPCHVGAPGMDVNHDLIAAGHPRLAFEFTAYHALLPHHWQDAKDKQPGASPHARADWDAAAWFVGQSLTSEAALALLATRASDKALPWPEFAEYDCYACHHQLQNQNWRQKRDFTKRKPGALAWNDWYASALPQEISPAGPRSQDLREKIARLKAVMEGSVVPDRDEVRKQAQAAATAQASWAGVCGAENYPPKEMAVLLRALASTGANEEAGSWEAAAQRYLAVVALYQAWRDARGNAAPAPELRDALVGIRKLLQFAPQSQSPEPDYTPRLLLDQYKLLSQRLGP